MDNIKTRWYKEAIIYQIWPFSFKDSNDDGMGDIPGIISKLDYIKELGVTAIWFSPLYESPDKDYGYDISDYLNMDSKFGTMDDFKTLISECHKRDLKVIMDMVVNHTSNEHKWFKEAISSKDSPYRDYYIIKPGKKKGKKLLPPNNWHSSFTGSAWERIEGTDDYYLHLFTKEQPDLNWENEKVREEIKNILKFYLDLGVDGFRFDVFNLFSKVQSFKSDRRIIPLPLKGSQYFIDGPRMHEFLNELNVDVLSKYDSMTVGESYSPSEDDALRYVSESSCEFDSLFNFAHFSSDSIFGLKYLKKKFKIMQFKNGLFDPQRKYYGAGWNTLVLENHDNPRCVCRFGLNYKDHWYEAATMLPICVYFMWGIPYIYQGQEIGMINNIYHSIDEFDDPVSHFIYNIGCKFFGKKKALECVNYGARDHARTIMQWSGDPYTGFSSSKPWTTVNPTCMLINVDEDLRQEKSVYRFYQEVLKLKRNEKALIYGTIKEVTHGNKNVIAYIRELEGKKFFVVSNFKDKKISYKLSKEVVNPKTILSNYDNVDLENGVIELAPYQAVLYEF